MEGLIQDLRYALRSIAGAKRFAAIVVATLALGIGANTAVFGVLNAVVLRPLPYDEPDRLVRVYQSHNGADNYLPAPVFVALRDHSRTLDLSALYTYAPEGADLTDRARPERVRTLRVSADYFRVLRVPPMLGSPFARADERTDARLAVVSHRIWREYLGGAADAIGRSLSLNGIAHRVTGVLPDGFADPLVPGVDVWTPVGVQPSDRGYAWGNNYLTSIGRLRRGATIAQAQAELATFAATLPWNTPRMTTRKTTRVAALQEDTVGSAGPMLWILLGAVGLLLLIACVNVASLFLARGAARQAEMAVRAALGCSRWRLTRQLLVESLVLSLTGGLAGLALSRAVTRTLLAAAPETVARMAGGGVEAAILAFSAGVAMLAGLAFGVAPALQGAHAGLEGVLRESGRSGTGSRRHSRARSVLVVCQIALALMLLIGAGLLLRSFDRLRSVSIGLDPTNVVTFEVHLPGGRYADAESRARFHLAFHERIAALPGVRAAGAISRLPVTGNYHGWTTRRDDLPDATPVRSFEQRTIEGDYFAALRIQLLRGRTFDASDDGTTVPRRVVVSQSAARLLFGDADPIGRRLRVVKEPVEIIGVVGDVSVAPRAPVAPTVYHAHRQFAGDRNWALTQVVALDRPSASLLQDVRRELAAIDPALVLHQPRPLTEVVGRLIAHERFAMLLIGAFAGLAVVLAAIGIYGVLSYAVSRRRREMGIRLALGAPVGAVSRLILRDGSRLAAIGAVLGLVGAYAATGTLASLLYGVSATDPLVFAAAAAALVAVALAASWIPARAATRVDPLHALRADG